MSPEDVLPDNERDGSGVVEPNPTYSIKYVLPKDPTVRLVFHGLMWFIFHGTDECQVAIHNSTRGTIFPHSHPHDFSIKVWTITDCDKAKRNCDKPRKIYDGNPKDFAGIQIDVNRPKETGVYVYQKDPFNPLDNKISDPNDWRWVTDFERAPLYPTGIKLKGEKVSPSVSINHGLFYTLHKTNSEFELIPDGGGTPHKIGNVAEYAGGNIYLENGGDVTLIIRHNSKPPEFIPLKWSAGVCYQIDISNNCMKGGKPCEFDPDHKTDKKKRNDFYLYYDTFRKPSGAREYELKRTLRVAAPEAPEDVCFEEAEKYHMTSSNDAPCGVVCASLGGS